LRCKQAALLLSVCLSDKWSPLPETAVTGERSNNIKPGLHQKYRNDGERHLTTTTAQRQDSKYQVRRQANKKQNQKKPKPST